MFNLLTFRFLYTFERETHNLEVLGSSPSWSTWIISNIEEILVADFSFYSISSFANDKSYRVGSIMQKPTLYGDSYMIANSFVSRILRGKNGQSDALPKDVHWQRNPIPVSPILQSYQFGVQTPRILFDLRFLYLTIACPPWTILCQGRRCVAYSDANWLAVVVLTISEHIFPGICLLQYASLHVVNIYLTLSHSQVAWC